MFIISGYNGIIINSSNCCCESVIQLRDIADLVRHASVLLLQDARFNCRKLFYKKDLRRTLFHQALFLATGAKFLYRVYQKKGNRTSARYYT
jgi:hypothetical protein